LDHQLLMSLFFRKKIINVKIIFNAEHNDFEVAIQNNFIHYLLIKLIVRKFGEASE
jgi:hypothetical protein